MLTDTLFLLDRNVVSVIKSEIAGRLQKGEKEQRMLEFLRSIDALQYAVSPLLSLIEGEHGREDDRNEKVAQLQKETEAISSFFRLARTDSIVLGKEQNAFAEVFTESLESNANARASFRKHARPLVIQPVAAAKRGAVEAQMLNIAVSSGLACTDAIVVLFIACLYGNTHARDVLKLSEPDKTHNVLNDIHVIPRIGFVKAVARGLPMRLKVRFLTLDEGLQRVLENIRIVDAQLTDDGELQMQLRYLPSLFPTLSASKAVELLHRLNRGETTDHATTR